MNVPPLMLHVPKHLTPFDKILYGKGQVNTKSFRWNFILILCVRCNSYFLHEVQISQLIGQKRNGYGARIAQRYSPGLRAGWSGVRASAGAGNFSLHHRVQTGSGVHAASYPVGTTGSFPGGKVAGA
jgi:hypothetical protein